MPYNSVGHYILVLVLVFDYGYYRILQGPFSKKKFVKIVYSNLVLNKHLYYQQNVGWTKRGKIHKLCSMFFAQSKNIFCEIKALIFFFRPQSI